MPVVTFQNADKKPVLEKRRKIKRFIPVLFSEYKISLQSLTVVFCSDEYLLSLNRDFLKHDYYTDILTFNLGLNEEITGEIYISIDRVKENALMEQVPFQQELLRVIFHGALHLCGLDDSTPAQKRIMTKIENETLIKFEAFHVKQ